MRPCILDIKMIALICIFFKILVNPDVIALRGRTGRFDMILPHIHYVMIILYTLSAAAMLGSAAAVGSSSTAAAPLPPPTRHQPPVTSHQRGAVSV